jgi:hypothetical protein
MGYNVHGALRKVVIWNTKYSKKVRNEFLAMI